VVFLKFSCHPSGLNISQKGREEKMIHNKNRIIYLQNKSQRVTVLKTMSIKENQKNTYFHLYILIFILNMQM